MPPLDRLAPFLGLARHAALQKVALLLGAVGLGIAILLYPQERPPRLVPPSDQDPGWLRALGFAGDRLLLATGAARCRRIRSRARRCAIWTPGSSGRWLAGTP